MIGTSTPTPNLTGGSSAASSGTGAISGANFSVNNSRGLGAIGLGVAALGIVLVLFFMLRNR